MTAIWAADLVDRLAVRPGERMLDLACGTGVVARMAAERAGSTGQIAALDIIPGMLAVARLLPPVKGAPIEWLEGSALALPFPDATYDLVLCQLGLQFFPDRPGALREISRVLVAGGRVGLNVFGLIEHNPATHALANALDRRLGPGKSVIKRAEHSLADTQTLRTLVSRGGFRDVTIATATKIISFARRPTTYESNWQPRHWRPLSPSTPELEGGASSLRSASRWCSARKRAQQSRWELWTVRPWVVVLSSWWEWGSGRGDRGGGEPGGQVVDPL
jgi:ubiquinone/menaquinone biosynthesis C-methylase UbiE